MMKQEEKQGMVKLALGSGLAALACSVGEPVGFLAVLGKGLLETVGGDFVSGWVDGSVNKVTESWFGEDGRLNHDVERVLGEALALAAGEVKQGLRRNHTFRDWQRKRMSDAQALEFELGELEADGVAAVAEWVASAARRAEVTSFMQGRGAGLEQAFAARVEQAFTGYERHLARQLRRQLAERWQAHFVELLKTDEKARFACEQLWRTALQESLQQIARQGEQSAAVLESGLKALQAELAMQKQEKRDDKGLQALFEQTLRRWLAQDGQKIVASLHRIEAGLEAVADEVSDVKEASEVLLDEVGEANQRLERIERLLGESTRVQQVEETRRLFCGVRPLPQHYIAREKEMSDLRQVLMDTHQVALTALTGMGGMGKTVLAQALAHDEACAARYPDGVLWAELGPQADEEADADSILTEWAFATGLIERMGDGFYRLPLASKSRLLATYLQSQRLLFIIDDVWHSAAAQLLTQVRGAKSGLLLTTRSAKIAQSLQLTDYTINQLQPDEALALLTKRRGQALSAEELPLAQELVQRLGYHPLAIELAAAQLSLPGRDWQIFLTPLRQEQGTIDLLALANSRHRSLQLCFDLSYENLLPDAQRAYRWLGVMATEASFGWQAMHTLWHGADNPRSLLHTLLDAALLEEASPERYRQHLLLREDALHRLTAEELPAALMRHGQLYRDVAEQAKNKQDYRPIERDYEQIEAILRRAWQSWQEKSASSLDSLIYARQDAFDLLNSLVFNCYEHYWNLQGIYVASLRWLPRAAGLAAQVGKKRDQGAHLGCLGLTYAELGEVDKAIGYYEQALEISHLIDRKQDQGIWLGNLGLAYADLGEVELAIEYYKQALEISRLIGHKRGEGNHLGNLGNAYRNLGELDRAIGYYQQALEISRLIGNKRGEGNCLGNLGLVYRNLGDAQADKAIDYYQQALEISRLIGHKRNEGNWLGNLGNAYRNLGEVELAIEYYEQALEISRLIGHKQGEGSCLGNLGNAYAKLGEVELAIGYYEQALEISHLIGDKRGEGNRLANLGLAYQELGQMERARALWREALGIYEAIKSPYAERVRRLLGG